MLRCFNSLITDGEMADIPIEDLRKWRAWDKADRVLAVRKTDAYKLAIVRRALLRYCLQAEGSAAATAYVAERRKADPDAVKDVEETLRLEQETLKQNSTPKKADKKAK